MTTKAADISNPLEHLNPVDSQEAARLGAAHTLGMRRLNQSAKDLMHAEAQARLDLAAAIIAMDEKDELIAAGQPLHSLNEQAAVEIAQRKYSSALADLIRGYANSSEER